MAGRASAVPVHHTKLVVMADALRDAEANLRDAAQILKTNNVEEMMLAAKTVMEVYLPGVTKLAGEALADAQPTVTAKLLGVKTRKELNQIRGQKQRAKAKLKVADETAAPSPKKASRSKPR